MSGMTASFGRGLVAFFTGCVALWALLLIAFPQLTMLDKSLRPPARALDSSVAETVMRDARTCISVLDTFEASAKPSEQPATSGGLGVPSIANAPRSRAGTSGGLAVPSIGGSRGAGGGLAVPSIGGGATPNAATPDAPTRGYILQCDRATTATRFVRDPDAEPESLITAFGLPELRVDDRASFDEQRVQAQAVIDAVRPVLAELKAREASALPYSPQNFAVIVAARAIPLSPETKAIEDAQLSNQLFDLVGLRFEKDGVVHVRLTLVTLLRTLFFAAAATLLALIVCYPIAYNLALASSGRKAVWLFLALVIPYAIVELMRVYAWVSLVETNGVFNRALDAIGVIDLEAGEAIPFKRSPLTIFVVIVYTYILFMVFPMVNVMSTLDRNQLEAGRDLGASTWRLHRRIVIPHAKPGIAVGCITTFMLAAGAFSVPRIVSRGLQSEWFSQTIYNKFFESENSNVGAAYSFAFTILCFVIVALFMWLMRARLKDFVRA
ncbi:MAG: ABC transporter permease [Pseudomonadota bacterium]